MSSSVDRQGLYKDTKVERLLLDLFDREYEMKPHFDSESGYRYLDVEKNLGEGAKESKSFLEKLANAGILDKKIHALDIRCPKCNGSNVQTNYKCPFCDSIDIDKNAIIEHIACGYIDLLANFKSGDGFVCPKCRSKLEADNYRSAGSWYSCLGCGKKMEFPSPVHECRDDGTKFDLDGASLEKIYSYTLNSLAREEIRQGVLLRGAIKERLERLGFRVESPSILVGYSGVEHSFDVLFVKGERRAAIDLLFSDKPIPQLEIIKEKAKLLDFDFDFYLVGIPGLGEEARKLAEFYKISVIEAAEPQKVLGMITEIFMQEKFAVGKEDLSHAEAEASSEEEKPKASKEGRSGFLSSLLKRKEK